MLKLVFLVTLLHFFTVDSIEQNVTKKILSRKKRYIIFPEGSSLQLVYCLTMPTIGMGKIFTIGSTAAMAWELPHEPILFMDKNKKSKPADAVEPDIETEKTPHESYLNRPEFSSQDYLPSLYDRKDNDHNFGDTKDEYSKYYDFSGYYRPPTDFSMNEHHHYNHPHYVEPQYRYIYRRTRRDLYGKFQNLFTAMNKDGRSCILKLICEVSHVAERKGSFMEEIIKAIFRIKPHGYMRNEDEYDEAFDSQHNCTERYNTCPETFFGGLF